MSLLLNQYTKIAKFCTKNSYLVDKTIKFYPDTYNNNKKKSCHTSPSILQIIVIENILLPLFERNTI